MTSEEMKKEIDRLDKIAKAIPSMIKLYDGQPNGSDKMAILSALDELLGGREVSRIEIARWYRDHAWERDSNMTEACNYYSDFLASPANKVTYPQYWGEAKETVESFYHTKIDE